MLVDHLNVGHIVLRKNDFNIPLLIAVTSFKSHFPQHRRRRLLILLFLLFHLQLDVDVLYQFQLDLFIDLRQLLSLGVRLHLSASGASVCQRLYPATLVTFEFVNLLLTIDRLLDFRNKRKYRTGWLDIREHD